MKTDNWRQIYKQTNSVFFSSNEVRLKNNVLRRKPVAVEVHISPTAYVIAVYFVSKGIPENESRNKPRTQLIQSIWKSSTTAIAISRV